MKMLSTWLSAISFVVLSGCSTMINGTDQQVSINSNVQGDSVMVNGVKMGETPFNGKLKRGANTQVTLSKEGYKPKEFTLETNVEAAVWLQLLVQPRTLQMVLFIDMHPVV